jgi:glycosyltransferase involved in cell wall biosynthesis
MKVTVVIPAKDEAETITAVLEGVRQYADELLVVDGHSRDASAELARASGARVVFDGGAGKGDAVRTAIREATGDVLVFVDADGSHVVDDVPKLVAPIVADEADLVVGSRPRGGSDEMTGDLDRFIRWLGQQIIMLGINYRFNVRLTDSQNGFRAIRRTTALEIDLQEDITTIEQEMLMKVLKKGYRATEVPSHEFERGAGRSKISLRGTWLRYVYSWLRYMFF